MWKLWGSIKISTADWQAWENIEKNDVQKLNLQVKSKSVVGEESVERLKHTGPNISLWNRAA